MGNTPTGHIVRLVIVCARRWTQHKDIAIEIFILAVCILIEGKILLYRHIETISTICHFPTFPLLKCLQHSAHQ